MDSETKNVPLRRLISVLQERADFPTDRAWWASLGNGNSERRIARSESRAALKNMGIELSSVVGHAYSVERVNKDHQNAVSRLRSTMAPERVNKLLYIYCNAKNMHKTDLPFDQFTMLMLDAEDARAILEGITFSETSLHLPSQRPDYQDEDEDEDDNGVSEDDGDEDDSFFATYQIPEGLEYVEKPDGIPTFENTDGRTSEYFVTCMWDVKTDTQHIWGWYVGKVLKYISNRTRFNYLIAYGEDPGTEQALRLENYKMDPPSEDEDIMIYDKDAKPIQTWAFLKKTR